MRTIVFATSLALLTFALTRAMAAPPSTAHQQAAMPAMQHDMSKMDMAGMKTNAHHVLAMAYMQNIRIFATALRTHAEGSGPLNTKLAREIVAEIDRSVDQVEKHHEAHVKSMSTEMRANMAAMMKMMDMHLSMIDDAVDVLSKDVRASQPDAKQVAAHAGELLGHLDAMSKMQP
jgi:hypothetical protein